MKINQTAFVNYLRTACKVAAFKDDLNLKKASNGTYIYSASELANNHPDTGFARAYKEIPPIAVDKEGRKQMQTCASKALSKVRAEEDDAVALAFRFGQLGLGGDDDLSAMSISDNSYKSDTTMDTAPASHANGGTAKSDFAILETVLEDPNNKQTEDASSSKSDAVSEETSRTFAEHFTSLIQDPHLDQGQKESMQRFMLNEIRSKNGISHSINIIESLQRFTSHIQVLEERGFHEQHIEPAIQMKKQHFEGLAKLAGVL